MNVQFRKYFYNKSITLSLLFDNQFPRCWLPCV